MTTEMTVMSEQAQEQLVRIEAMKSSKGKKKKK